MKKALLITLGVSGLALLIFFSMRSAGQGEDGTRVYAEAVERRDLATVVKASGTVDARVSVDLSSQTVAKIERLYFEEGDEVRAGQAFAELEREAFAASRDDAQARVRQAEIDVDQAEVDLEEAERIRRRAESLAAEDLLSTEELEGAQTRARSAQITLERRREAVRQARAGLARALDDLSKTTIYSPISGRVVELNAEEGEVVVSGMMNNPATKIATIADLSEILAEVDVDENEIVDVEIGQEVTLDVDAVDDVQYQGRVTEVGSSSFTRASQPDVKFFRVKVLFEDPDLRLRPGMSVVASIHVAESRDTLVVPVQSVVARSPLTDDPDLGGATLAGDGAGIGDDETIDVVFVVEDGQLVQRPVQTGLSDITSVEILDGLTEDDEVITGPFRTLKDLEHGDAVRVVSESDDDEEEE